MKPLATPDPERGTGLTAVTGRPALTAMMEARSVALVGASPRPGSFGHRMVTEMGRSPAAPAIHLVNPRHARIGDRVCHPALADVPGPVDLVLLGVPDTALEEQLGLAAGRGDASAVIFGSAHEIPGELPGLRARLAATASAAGMALCGAGCMGFVNLAHGLRAVGYVEPDELPAGPVALVTHSGSVFSALLRSHRAIGFTVAVSSGQELVTPAAAYARYALGLPSTRVLALVLEAMREAGQLRQVLAEARARDIPVVLLTAGSSARGRAMVSAHSGALAAADGGWEALCRAYGVHRVRDLAEMADTLELFCAGRRAGPGAAGIATVHDSGLERAHVADLADHLGVPFAPISDATKARLAGVLDPGLEPANPLDMWGTGTAAEEELTGSLTALADDPAAGAVALAVDLVHEFDGDRSYPRAALRAAECTAKPVAVLANVPGAIDAVIAAELRAAGVPVLEGTRSGLLALGHLLDHAAGSGRPASPAPRLDPDRQARWSARLAAGEASGAALFGLLSEYGIRAAAALPATGRAGALAAAAAIGYPVVLKTAGPAAHKSDVGGVLTGVTGPEALAAGYDDMAARLGPAVLVCEQVPPGTEIAVGIARDPDLGPLVVAGAGGVLVELLADRAVALPPVDAATALGMLGELRVSALLAGARGRPAADLGAVAAAIAAVSVIACELGGALEALDVNPLICGPDGAVAVDALAIPRGSGGAGLPAAWRGDPGQAVAHALGPAVRQDLPDHVPAGNPGNPAPAVRR